MSKNTRILLVEDTKAMAMMVVKMVENATGLPVDLAENLSEARKFISVSGPSYAIALLDLSLPDAPDGEIAEVWQQHGIPSVVFSGKADESQRTEFFSEGVIDYVVKDSFSAVVYLSRLVKQLMDNREFVAILAGDESEIGDDYKVLTERLLVKTIRVPRLEDIMATLDDDETVQMVLIGEKMGSRSGLEVIRKIREKFDRERIAIVGVPGQNRLMASQFIKNGADDYILAPIYPEEYCSRINAVLERKQLLCELSDVANCDFLTGCRNRRSFFEDIDNAHRKAKASGQKTAIVMIDIDHFKSVNDDWGHDVGDQVLKSLGQALREDCPRNSIVARFGGEEFALFIPAETDAELESYLSELIEETGNFKNFKDGLSITVSAGACVLDDEEFDIDAMLRIADEQLYKSKNAGRNQYHLINYRDSKDPLESHGTSRSGSGDRDK